MTTVIEGTYLKMLLVPFLLIMVFTLVVVLITITLIRKELKNEEKN